jgi:rhamnosyltransferase
MEDKKWQRAASELDLRIEVVEEALVLHSHDYGLATLSRRCESEGYGWRLLGESYMLRDMVADMLRWDVHRELVSGIMTGRARTPAELVFPWLRPWKLFAGNRFGTDVQR